MDPSTNMIIAEGHGTQGHPLHHTVLNLVDLVARSQGGGALQHTSSLPTFNYTKVCGEVPCLYFHRKFCGLCFYTLSLTKHFMTLT